MTDATLTPPPRPGYRIINGTLCSKFSITVQGALQIDDEPMPRTWGARRRRRVRMRGWRSARHPRREHGVWQASVGSWWTKEPAR